MKKLSFSGGLIIGLIIGCVLGFYLGSHIVNQIRNQIEVQSGCDTKYVEVICATHDLSADIIISKSDLGKLKTIKNSLPFKHCMPPSDVDKIIGRKLLFKVNRGDPILWLDIEKTTEIPETIKTNKVPEDTARKLADPQH